MQEYSSTKSTMDELYQIRKNYGIYMDKDKDKEMERWLFYILLLPCLFDHALNCFINIENCTFSIYPSIPKINS